MLLEKRMAGNYAEQEQDGRQWSKRRGSNVVRVGADETKKEKNPE
jgi:hypothetical protein